MAKFYDYILGIVKQCGMTLMTPTGLFFIIIIRNIFTIGIKHGISFPTG